MGAKQSKRSVDISAGATKAEKGPAGEPLENGTITTASTDEKLVEANGEIEETPKQNGSTPHVDEKETSDPSSPAKEVKEPVKTDEGKTEIALPEVLETNGDLDTTADNSAKSPTDEPAEVLASAEKKRKKKKSWSFRSISFSKKDKSKPTIKEHSTTDVKTETVPEVVEEEIVKEIAKPIKSESNAEDPKASEESPAVVDEKDPISETPNVAEVPPPLPSSPPPVETPAVPTSTVIETSTTVETTTTVEETTTIVETPTIIETPAPIQPAETDVPQAEPEDDTVGGGEGLAEPPEGLNTSDIEKEVAEVPLVNGNHVEDVKPMSTSSDVQYLSEKIESIKLSNAAGISEVTHEISNDSCEVNGVSNEVSVTNGDGGCDGRD